MSLCLAAWPRCGHIRHKPSAIPWKIPQLWAPACPSATPAGLSPLAARDWHFGCRASPPCRCLLSDEGHVVIASSSKEHLLCCQEFPETPSPSSSSSLPSRAAGCLPQGKGDTGFGVTPACSRGPNAVGCACGGKERQCRPGGTFRACNIQHGGHTGQDVPQADTALALYAYTETLEQL